MRRNLAALALIFVPGIALAQDPMTVAEFEAYVTGKTLTYSQFGQPYGIEEYLPDRRVRWAFTEDICQYGRYYEEDPGLICFVYEDDPSTHCWTFWLDGTGLKALSVTDPPGSELSEVSQTGAPLGCAGPEVGV